MTNTLEKPQADDLAHEALHTTHVLLDMFERHVRQAAAVQGDVKLRDRADEIGDQLADLYQALGAKLGEQG